MGALFLLITAILATLVLYFWARKAQLEKELLEQRQEQDRIMSIAEDLKSRLRLRDKSFDMLDRLCEQYYIYEGTENLHPKIVKEVRTIVEGLRNDPSVQKNLEQSLNTRYDGVMTTLRSAFPSWKEEDYLIFMFTAAGFSSTTISTLIEKDKPYVYNRVYRIKERIKLSGTTHRDALLAVLER